MRIVLAPALCNAALKPIAPWLATCCPKPVSQAESAISLHLLKSRDTISSAVNRSDVVRPLCAANINPESSSGFRPPTSTMLSDTLNKRCLLFPLTRGCWLSPSLQHQSVGVSDILFQFSKGLPLAEDARNFSYLAHKPVTVFPVFQGESCSHLFRPSTAGLTGRGDWI